MSLSPGTLTILELGWSLLEVKGPAHCELATSKFRVKHCHFNNPITLLQATIILPKYVTNGLMSVMGKLGMLAEQVCPPTGTIASTVDQKPFPPKVNAVKYIFLNRLG